MSDVKWLSQ